MFKQGKGNIITIIITVLFIAAITVGTLTQSKRTPSEEAVPESQEMDTQAEEFSTSDKIDDIEDDLGDITTDLDDINLEEFGF